MQIRNLLTIMTGLSVAFSSSIVAHIDDSSAGLSGILWHPFTGIDHLLTMVLVGLGIAYYVRKQRHQDK
jgi:hydrogenase/urease accessory protein HupE